MILFARAFLFKNMSLLLSSKIYKLAEKASRLSEEDFFIKVFSDDGMQKFVTTLNVKQMTEGFMNSEGVQLSDIGGDYSPVTIQISEDEGRPKKGIDKIDLHNTGEFHESIRIIRVTGTEFQIGSNPIKDDGTNLLTEWGKGIIGLTAGNKSELSRKCVVMYRDLLRKYLTVS